MQKFARFFRWGLALGTAGLVACSFPTTSNAAEPEAPQKPLNANDEPPSNFSAFFLAGGVVRIDDAPLYDITRRVGGNFGLGFMYRIKPVTLGLSYEYAGLGDENSGVRPYGFVQLSRSLSTVLASIKMRFSGLTWGTPYVGLAAGPTWQGASMKGVYLFDRGATGSSSFACSARDSMNLALRFGGGLEIPASRNVSVITDASFDAYRLSSDIIEGCAPGAGATSAFLLRVGLAYTFDATVERPVRPTPRP